MQGRILIFSCEVGKVRLVAEKDIRGGAMVLRPFQVLASELPSSFYFHWL